MWVYTPGMSKLKTHRPRSIENGPYVCVCPSCATIEIKTNTLLVRAADIRQNPQDIYLQRRPTEDEVVEKNIIFLILGCVGKRKREDDTDTLPKEASCEHDSYNMFVISIVELIKTLKDQRPPPQSPEA